MANKGETKSQKSISAPATRYFSKKESTFTVKGRPGPHNKNTSVPLSFTLVKILELAKTTSEAKKIIADGQIKINGTIRRNSKFPTGIFDIITIDAQKKKYRILLDKKGRLVIKEIDAKSKDFKISKVISKRIIKKGKIEVTTNDGFTITLEKEKINVNDSLKLSMPEQKIEEIYPLAQGNTAYIVGGAHVGDINTVKEIIKGTLQRKELVSLENENAKFQTVTRNVFVIGKEKTEIEVLKKWVLCKTKWKQSKLKK